MLLKTILNRIEKHSSFVYQEARFRDGDSDVIEIDVRPRRGARAICSGCSRRGPTYDTLSERAFQFVPLWGMPVYFVYSMRRVCCRRCGIRVESVPSISQHGLRVSKGRLEARINRLLDDPDLHDESLRLAEHLVRNRDALFLFLDRADVEAANHLAEQAIRPAAINRKTSGGNRPPAGARAQSVPMSVLRTCKLRCTSAMEVFRQMLRDPVPTAHLAR